MFTMIREAWEFGADVRARGHTIHAALAVAASYLVITAVWLRERPTDVLSRLSPLLGLDGLTRWLTTDGPPALLATNATIAAGCAAVLKMLLLLMVALPLGRGRWNAADVDTYGADMTAARIGSTAWLLALLTVHTGGPTALLDVVPPQRWLIPLLVVAAVAVVACVVVGRISGSYALLWIVLHLVGVTLKAVAFAAISLLVVPASFLLWSVGWLLEDRSQWAKDRAVRAAAGMPAPTGAVDLTRFESTMPAAVD